MRRAPTASSPASASYASAGIFHNTRSITFFPTSTAAGSSRAASGRCALSTVPSSIPNSLTPRPCGVLDVTSARTHAPGSSADWLRGTWSCRGTSFGHMHRTRRPLLATVSTATRITWPRRSGTLAWSSGRKPCTSMPKSSAYPWSSCEATAAGSKKPLLRSPTRTPAFTLLGSIDNCTRWLSRSYSPPSRPMPHWRLALGGVTDSTLAITHWPTS